MRYTNRSIYMPVELIEAFSKHTGLGWSGIEIEGAICDAIEAAMKPQPGQAQAQALQDATAAGYQWKQIFLPEGTVLRASFDRQSYYAVVEGAEIKYGEYSLSPSAFANLRGSGNRNAWKAVWLRFPNCPDWVRADECRAVRKALTARLFQPAQPDEVAQLQCRARCAGRHEQHYTASKPSRDDAVPLYKLLQELPDTAEEPEAADEDSAAPDTEPAAAYSRPDRTHDNAQHRDEDDRPDEAVQSPRQSAPTGFPSASGTCMRVVDDSPSATEKIIPGVP